MHRSFDKMKMSLLIRPIGRLGIGLLLLNVVPGCSSDDEYVGAATTTKRVWFIRAPPTIFVDLFDGSIVIEKGSPGEVRATLGSSSSCKNISRGYAAASLTHVTYETAQKTDYIRIVSRRTDNGACQCVLQSSLVLFVPDGSSLDLRTNVGSIWVKGSPAKLKAESSLGAMLFELGAPPNSTAHSISPDHLSLRGIGGDVEITSNNGQYAFTGAVRVVPGEGPR